MFTLYNVISADGFIARNDGSEDFIPDELWQNFLDLCREYKTVIMGRNTYDAIQKYDRELLRQFEELPVERIVISGNRSFDPKKEYTVLHSPEEAFKIVPDALVSSGPTLNAVLLKNGMVGKIILHEVPTAIGDGIKPFDDGGVSLTPIDTAVMIRGARVRKYTVEK